MILVHRACPLSPCILVRINYENSCRLHVLRITTADPLVLRRSLSSGICLIISKLIALNLLLLLVSIIHPDLGQYGLSRLSTYWTLPVGKVGCRVDEGIRAEDPFQVHIRLLIAALYIN